MAHKLLIFVAAVPEENVLDGGKFPAILETKGERITIPPAVLCDLESGFDVQAAKNKMGESIDKLAAKLSPNKEQPTDDPKILAGRKPRSPKA